MTEYSILCITSNGSNMVDRAEPKQQSYAFLLEASLSDKALQKAASGTVWS